MKKFFCIIGLAIKHLLKLIAIIGMITLITVGLLAALGALLQVDPRNIFWVAVALGVAIHCVLEAMFEYDEKKKEKDLEHDLDEERRHRFFMEN